MKISFSKTRTKLIFVQSRVSRCEGEIEKMKVILVEIPGNENSCHSLYDLSFVFTLSQPFEGV